MKTSLFCCKLLLVICLVLPSCEDSSSSSDDELSSDDSRSFLMGFTPWPYEATTAAIENTYTIIQENGDMVAHHLQGGVPWDDALSNASTYVSDIENNVSGRLNDTEDDKKIYLAIDSLNSGRDGLTLEWNASGESQARSGVWSGRSFDDAEVIQAYSNFAINLIERFNPTHFNYGTEASDLMKGSTETEAAEFKVFAAGVYNNIKAAYPDLPLMISVALKDPGSTEMVNVKNHIADILDYIDVVGVSVYPYAFFTHTDKGNPDNLPDNWLSQINDIVPGKPIAITEAGWIGEDLEISAFGLNETSNEAFQNTYIARLLSEANGLDAELMVLFTAIDYDVLWADTLGSDNVSAIWRDTGLIDENLNERAALETWREYLSKDQN